MPRIIEAIERQKHSADWLKNKGQFIPMPGNWLRGKRWEDTMETPMDDAYLSEVKRMVRNIKT
jgi:hypothetical protein